MRLFQKKKIEPVGPTPDTSDFVAPVKSKRARASLFARKNKAAAPTPPYASAEAQYAGAQYAQGSAADLTVGDYAQGVPQIRVGEMLKVFGRYLPAMTIAFLLGSGVIYMMTKDMKRTYAGEGRVLAQISSEYVYEPVAGQTSPGLMITPDHIVLNEIGIMTSPAAIRLVRDQALSTYAGKIDPEAEEMLARANARGDYAMAAEASDRLNRAFERNFAANPQAKSSVINMSFKHEDPEIAVGVLNMFIEAYKRERSRLFVTGTADQVSKRREATETQLSTNEARIASFLRRNNISDFTSERTGATTRTEALKTELNTLRGTITETERALAEVEDQLRATPVTIDLFVDDRASQRVAQAELELKQLLAKYLPSSDPVRLKQTEIAELKSLQAGNGGRAQGGRRVGPNPVQQTLTTRRNTLQASADSLREKEYVLQQQLNGADGKSRRMRDLSPQMENLLRERDTLQARLRSLNTREQEALINQAQSQADSENVKVISYAQTPRKGRNMGMIFWLLGTVAWGGLVFLLGLLSTFLNPRLYASQSARTLVPGAPGGRRMDDLSIPEPVQPYIPATPEPMAPPFQSPAYGEVAQAPIAPAAYTMGATAVAMPVSTPVDLAVTPADVVIAEPVAQAPIAQAPITLASVEAPIAYDAPTLTAHTEIDVAPAPQGPVVFAESYGGGYHDRAPLTQSVADRVAVTESSANPYMQGGVAQLFNADD